MAVRIDVTSHAGDRRVVRWNRSVQVQPQDFSLVERPVTRLQLGEGRQVLRAIRLAEVGKLIGAEIADREVQLPIGTDDEAPALMIRAGGQAGQDLPGGAEPMRARSAGVKVPSSTRRSTCAGFLPSNGNLPTNDSYKSTPSPNTSALALTSPPSICSGAMCAGEPRT